MTNIDQNEILAKVAMDSLERGVGLFIGSLDRARQSVSVKLGIGFKEFKSKSRERYGSIRTLLHRDRPIALNDLYVPATFQHDNHIVADDELLSDIMNHRKIMIRGTAGGGKSIFLRFLNLVACNSKSGVLPVFFELKTLNDGKSKSLFSAISEYIGSHIPEVNEGTLEDLMADGRLLLLLDGFDEVDFDHRAKYAKEISEIFAKYPKTSAIITTRPDDLISSLEGIEIYNVMPFTEAQCVCLLENLPYDLTVRSKFIKEVESGLYKKHKDFLSNPLLITMMLMTYHQFAEIPNKIHIFYQQAFEALFSWHDSSKDVFKRKTYSNLPIDEFQRVFARFCASTYAQQKFTFSSISIREALKSAIDEEILDTTVDKLLRDLLESTCLLQREGLDIVFVHRSFQEYFTAVFLSRLDSVAMKRGIDEIARRASSDIVLPMCQDMNPAHFEAAWTLPTLNAILKKVDEIDSSEKPAQYFLTFFREFSIRAEYFLTLTYSTNIWGRRLMAIDRNYPRTLKGYNSKREKEDAKAFINKLRNSTEMMQELLVVSGPDVSSQMAMKKFPGLRMDLSKVGGTSFEMQSLKHWAIAHRASLYELRGEVEGRVRGRKAAFRGIFGGQ